MKKYLMSAIALFILASCHVPSRHVQSKFMNSAKKEGMIVGTICFENDKFSTYQFFYSKDSAEMVRVELNKKIAVSGQITIQAAKGDFKSADGKKCFMYNIVAPEGKYRFSTFRKVYNTGYAQSYYYHETDIPFEVTQGKITYLGQINVNSVTGVLTLEDQIERDRKKFKELDPNMNLIFEETAINGWINRIHRLIIDQMQNNFTKIPV